MNRFKNKAFWVAVFAFIALTGQIFDLYQVPDGWDLWVNSAIILLTAMGIIIDPTSPNLKDRDKNYY